MNTPIEPCAGYACFFTNSSYNCPALRLYGYSTERKLRGVILGVQRKLAAQSQLCADFSKHLDKQIHG